MIRLKTLLLEQPSDFTVDRRGNNMLHALGVRSDNNHKQAQDIINQLSANSREMDLDDMVDMVSFLLDATGYGVGVSTVIDVAHAISYFIRFKWFSDTDTELFENMAMGILTGIAATVPVAGNITAIAARQTIKAGIDLTKHAPKIASYGWKAIIAVLLKREVPQETLESGIETLSNHLNVIQSKIKQSFGNIDLLSVFSRVRNFLEWLLNTALPNVVDVKK